MGMSEGGVTAVEEALRLRPTWINGGGDLPGPGGSVIAAMLAVASGLCRHVLCFRTVWESTYAALRLGAGGGGGGGGGRVSGPTQEWRAPFGAMSAANWIGMNANHYLHRYGAPREMLGWIALNGRANAARNPAAIYRNPMTMDDYLSARPITSPFGLYDCDVPCDASIAVVVSDASLAADLPKPAVRVEAAGASRPTSFRSTRTAASSPRDARTASASSTKPWLSSGTRPASGRSHAPGPPSSPPEAGRHQASCSCAETRPR
jgi:acetyl-CoA acetyltransferase